MPQGKQLQSRSASPSHQRAAQSQAAQTSSTAPQVSPMAMDFFMQMQRTAGNRATQAYTNQLIQRNTTATQQAIPVPAAVQTPAPGTTCAPGTPAPGAQVVPGTPAPGAQVVPGTPAPGAQVVPGTPAPGAQVVPGTPAPGAQVVPGTPAPGAQVVPGTPAPGTPAPVAVPAPRPVYGTLDAPDTASSVTDAQGGAVSTFSDSFGARADDLKDSYDTTSDAATGQQAASFGAVAATADLVAGPFQILNAIRETMEVSGDSSRTVHNKNWNYAATGSSMIESTGKMVSGSAGLVDKAAKSSGQVDGVGASSAVSDYAGTVGEAISAVKSTIMAVKGIYDLYDKHSKNGGLDKGEKSKGAIEIVSNAISAAHSSLKVAKGIMEIMETGAGSLTSVIPGVSIAVSGVKIAIKTVDVIKAGLNRSAMTTLKREFKGKHANASYIKAKRWFGGNAGVDKVKMDLHKQTLRDKIANGSAQESADAQIELDEITQYELAKEMKKINVKRTTRGGLQIGLELTKIAADIATLTGVGAQVGTPLKIVASGVGAAMPVVRSLKQAGRDRAAKADAWGITKAVFNADKSTEKKHAKRVQDAELILDMIHKLPARTSATPDAYINVDRFIEAAGVSTLQLDKYKTDLPELRKFLVDAMAKRE
ncbi:hypothetical protein GCM10008018_18660 [Paenibacillus marchantiophytorum]|uniref:Uncharacterized protein n=1 Tax=Paenibacillus marchantiophytorum TaxID=1619310 RepID=A0ABQ2BVC7_9BACL|nr:hypothetical protein [Paenibacillus marchantiophytorum]GGI46755.1 hypothetical protein GCM10008018_18660 [Paenibacillus marchantiophytorum]